MPGPATGAETRPCAWSEQRAPERRRRRDAGTLETTTPSGMQTERRRRSRAVRVRRGSDIAAGRSSRLAGLVGDGCRLGSHEAAADSGQRARCRGGRRRLGRGQTRVAVNWIVYFCLDPETDTFRPQ
jgi:hypothetical protein